MDENVNLETVEVVEVEELPDEETELVEAKNGVFNCVNKTLAGALCGSACAIVFVGAKKLYRKCRDEYKSYKEYKQSIKDAEDSEDVASGDENPESTK